MPKSETKKQVKDTVAPQENFKIENIQIPKYGGLILLEKL